MNRINLRKFPYPFQSALTICSDIDGTPFKSFLEIHKFLNSDKNTSLGKGLELPIGDSFWMYDKSYLPNSAFSYFKGYSNVESDYAPIIRELIQAGIIDVMHGYGNFNLSNQFSRRLAEQAVNELDKRNLKLFTWTNHGGAENFQNIGRQSFGKGDQKDQNEYYHADLLKDYGITFYWDSEALVSNIVGQDRDNSFVEAYFNNPLFRGHKQNIKQMIKGLLSVYDALHYKLKKQYKFIWSEANSDNRLLTQDTLQDGTDLLKFKRFGHGRYDWSEDFSMLTNEHVLNKLVQKEGYLILYIHFGDRKVKTDKILTDSTIQSLKRIKEFYRSGKIWVDTTSNLLSYNRIHSNLHWSVEESEFYYLIIIDSLAENYGTHKEIEKYLAGITFIVPLDKDVKIICNNHELTYRSAIVNNHKLVYFPLKKIEWPLNI